MLPFFSDPASVRIVLLLASVPLLVYALIGLDASVNEEELRTNVGTRREQRRVKREKSNVAFDLDVENNDFTAGNARLIDLSVWGSCISTTVQLKKGQHVRGRIRSSSEGFLQVSGRVAWLKQKGGQMVYGIAFDKVTRLSSS